MNNTYYFDWAATAIPERDIIRKTIEDYFYTFGNPSSIHDYGLRANSTLNESRESFAGLLGVSSDEVTFTSGGTESNNIVIFNLLKKLNIESILKNHPKIILSSIEHSSFDEPATTMARFGFTVERISTKKNGMFNIDEFAEKLDERTQLVSVMYVNNETGAIQPIDEASGIVQDFSRKTGRKIHFHTDAIQALGKIPVELKKLPVDSASFSAHKIGGPKGTGVLYLKNSTGVSSLFRGGSQEKGKRPGTENLPSAVAFERCLEKYAKNMRENYGIVSKVSNCLIGKIRESGIGIIIPEERIDNPSLFSPYILTVSFPPIPSEVLVRALSERGIMVSAGSACSSRNPQKRARVLRAMGITEEVAGSAVRFSFGPSTSERDIEDTFPIISETVFRLKRVAGR